MKEIQSPKANCRMLIKRLWILLLVRLVISAVWAQSETPTPAPTQTPLPVFPIRAGSTIEGGITEATGSIRYRFDASAGDTVSIHMETTSGDLDPFLTLFGPDGELVEQNDDSDGSRNAAINTTVTRQGAYTIEAGRYQGGGARSVGTFRLALEIAGITGTNPTDPLANVPDFGLQPPPALIAYQQSGAGALEDAAERQYFALAGQQGDLVRVIMATTSGDLTPQIDMLNRSQVSILSSEVQTRPTESTAYATLPETGWYLVAAGRRSGSGSFDLYVDRIVAGAVLTPGDVVAGEFTLGTPTVSYVFAARMGDLIAANLFAADEASGVTPELRLLDVSFRNIARSTGSRFATLRATIPRSGTYILQVGNLRPDASGGYNLRLSSVPADASKLSVVQAAYNERYRGFVNDDEPMTFYRFSGKAGERVTIEMNTTSGNLDPYLILMDGDLNAELTLNDNVGASRNARIVQYRLEKDGDYLILATRSGLSDGASIGGFDLALTVGNLALSPGAFTATLNWSAAADLNLFVQDPGGRTVSWANPRVPSGGTLQIDSNANCETPTDQPVEHIFWGGDAPLPGDYRIWAWYQQPCQGDAPVPFHLDVRVEDRDVLQTDEDAPALLPGQRFEVRVRVLDDGTAFVLDNGRVTSPTPQQAASEGGDPLIVYGESRTATIGDDVYARFFQFDGAQGDVVVITAETLNGSLDPVLVLRDADDHNLPGGSNDDADAGTRNAHLVYTLPASDQYIIAVTRFGGRDGTTMGAFRLTVEKQG